MWYGVQNMSKYDIDIKVQPLNDSEQLTQAMAREVMYFYNLLMFLKLHRLGKVFFNTSNNKMCLITSLNQT